MNVNLKMFCILCLCIILCDTSKSQKIWLFLNKVSFCQVFLVWVPWRTKPLWNKSTLDLFQNFDVPEEISVNFDPEEDLNDNAVRSNYARESIILPRRTSDVPLKELSRVKLRRLTQEHIFKEYPGLPKFIIIPVELMHFVMLRNSFREHTCEDESKRKSHGSSERWFNNPSLRKTYKHINQ